ncbi:MAG: hypothetical protein WD749_05380 [Phycisphaerales bacterium]
MSVPVRPGFIPVGRLVVYLVILAALVGGYVVFQRYIRETEESSGEMTAPDGGDIARAVSDQHRSASTNPGVLPLTDAAKLSDQLGIWLGTRKTVEELFEERKGPSFVGARESTIPGAGPGAQLVFRTDASGGTDKTASLFLKKYMWNPVLPEDRAFSLEGTGPAAPTITVWRRGGLVYYIVGPRSPADALRTGLGAPAASAPFDPE